MEQRSATQEEKLLVLEVPLKLASKLEDPLHKAARLVRIFLRDLLQSPQEALLGELALSPPFPWSTPG